MRYGSQEPTFVTAPTAKGAVDALDGIDAVTFAARFGLTLDPWQAALCELWMRRDAKSGKFLAGTWGISVPRQNGKNGTLEAIELYGMVVLGLNFMHTAHEVKTAQKHFRRMKEFFGQKRGDENARFPELNRLVREVRNTNGQEAIFLHNPVTRERMGGIEIAARSDGAGRGFTNDVLVIDEAQHLKDEHLEASRPSISAAPSGDPVAIYMGTPPKPSALSDEGAGAAFVRIRNGAVTGSSKRSAWMEFGLEIDAESMSSDELKELASNRAHWATVNPALGRRLFEQTLADELEEMGARSFVRERLNVWPVPRENANARLDVDQWNALSVPTSSPEWPLAAVGLDMDVAGRTWLAIGAHADEPVVHVELTPDDPLEGGVDAAVETLWRVCKRRRPVVLPSDSGASVLVPALKAREMKVYLLAPSEMAQASMGLAQAMKDKTISHLDDAVLAQGVRESSGVGMKGSQWRLGRDGEQGGAPIQAVACARMGAVKWAKRRPRDGERVGRSRERVTRQRAGVGA